MATRVRRTKAAISFDWTLSEWEYVIRTWAPVRVALFACRISQYAISSLVKEAQGIATKKHRKHKGSQMSFLAVCFFVATTVRDTPKISGPVVAELSLACLYSVEVTDSASFSAKEIKPRRECRAPI